MVRAGDMCPAPPKYHTPTASDIAKDDHRIHVDSDDAALDAAGHAVLNGRVRVRQDARSVTSDSVNYDEKTGRVSVKGAVDFEDPKLRVRSDSGHYDINGAANFDQSNFQLMDRNGRGFAKEIDVRPDGKLSLTSVRYTTCPVGNEDWMLQASSLNLDTKVQEGVAPDVTMRFKDVPIFYTPYISFPVGDERKSGLLFPSFGHSGNNGFELQVPYYFNLAPNYDLVLTPGLLSARGVQLGEQFRYLTASSHGQVDATFLPSDALAHGDRSYVRITDITEFKRGMRFDADIASVSDSRYFEDFAVGSDQTSVTFLLARARRAAELPNHRYHGADGVQPSSAQSDAHVDPGGLRPAALLARAADSSECTVAHAGHAHRICAGQRDRQFRPRCRSDGSALQCGAGDSLVESRARLLLRASHRLRLHAVRPEECRRRGAERVEHAHSGAALRARG